MASASKGTSSRGSIGVVPSTPWVTMVRSTYEKVHEALWRSILGWSGSREVADEAVAEAFAQLLRRGDEVRDPAAWVWRSAYRIASGDLARRRSGAARFEGLDRLEGGARGSGGSGSSGVRGVGDRFDDGRIHDGPEGSARAAIELLGSLSEQQRQCVVLVDLAGHTAVSAADVLGTSAETVRTQLVRARRLLRTEMGRPAEETP